MYWACLRSGLYITAVNYHLTAGGGGVHRRRLRRPGADRLGRAGGPGRPCLDVHAGGTAAAAYGGAVPGFGDYEDALAARRHRAAAPTSRAARLCSTPPAPPGGPRACRPALPDRQVDEPGDTYVRIFGALYGFGQDTVYLSPAPIYHAAPLRFGGVVQALGGTRRDDGALRRRRRRWPRSRSTGSRTRSACRRCSCGCCKLPDEVRAPLRRVQPAGRRPRGGAVPGRGQAADDRVVGPGARRSTTPRTEGNGIDDDRQRAVAGPPGLGRATALLGVGAHLRRGRARARPPGEVGAVYFERDAVPFRYHGDPGQDRGRPAPRAPELDHASATSATSTRTATCSSPTARPS